MKLDKMFNYLMITALLVIPLLRLAAQTCEAYYPIEAGTHYEMKSYDEKDKFQGSGISRILKAEQKENELLIAVEAESFDEKGKSAGKGELEMRCKDGVFYMDMKKFLDQKMLSEYKDAEVSIESTDMEMPAVMVPGQNLKDASVTMKVTMGGMNMFTFKVLIKNRKVEGFEPMTTPAGTFDCVKMSSEIETKMMMTTTIRSTEWYARNVGVVRSESYNQKGKMLGYTILASYGKD